MWIAKIELFNFKSYQHQTFEFPQPRAGRNIVLIGGMNGYGKTSVLEALYLGLYGKEAVEHLGRAGLKDDVGYRKFVERALHGTAIRTGRDSMWVKTQINQSKAEGFEVTARVKLLVVSSSSQRLPIAARQRGVGYLRSFRVEGDGCDVRPVARSA